MKIAVLTCHDSWQWQWFSGHASRRGVRLIPVASPPEPAQAEVIYLIGNFPGTSVYEIELPARMARGMLESALEMELASRLPIPLENIEWGYWQADASARKFRLYAMEKEVLSGLFGHLRQSGFVCDHLIPAALLAGNPAAAAEDPVELLKNILPDDPGGRRFEMSRRMVPADLQPVRYRSRQLLCWLLLAALTAALALTAGRRWQHWHASYEAWQAYNTEQARELEALRFEYGRRSRELALAEQLASLNLDTVHPAAVLAELTEALSEHMWVSRFSLNADSMDLDIVSSLDDRELFDILNAGSTFVLVNMRKANHADGTTRYQVRLKGRKP